MKEKLLKLLLTIASVIYIVKSADLSFLDLVNSDEVVISVRAKDPIFVWLQQVVKNPVNNRTKMYIRSEYKNFTNTSLFAYEIPDLNDELVLEGYDEKNLSCALFLNKTEQRFYLHKFPTKKGESAQVEQLPNTIPIASNVTNNITLSSSCNSFVINMSKTWYYTTTKTTNTETNQTKITGVWQSIEDFAQFGLIGRNSFLNAMISPEYVFLLYAGQNPNPFYDQTLGVFMDVKQGQEYYYLSSEVDLLGYTHAEVRYYEEQMDRNMYYKNNRRIVIFASRWATNKFLYKLYFLYENEKWETNIIEMVEGDSLTTPQFVCSQNLTKTIVYGNTTDGRPFYNGYFVEYAEDDMKMFEFPTTITKYHNSLSLSEYFLYVRNRQVPTDTKKGNYSLYVCLRHKIIPFFQQKVIQEEEFNNNWYSSFLGAIDVTNFLPPLNTKVQIYHLHTYFNRFYFKTDEFDAFSSKEAAEYADVFQLAFRPQGVNTTAKSIKNDMRWIYSVQKKTQGSDQVQTTIFAIDYNEEIKPQKSVKINTTLKGAFNVFNYSYDKGLDCFYVANTAKMTLDIYSIDYIEMSITLLGNITAEKFPASQAQISLGYRCTWIKLFEDLYMLNTETKNAIYYKQTLSFNMTKTSFDPSFTFAIQDDKLYKFDGTTFNQILAEIEFMPVNEIHVNEDFNIMAVVTKSEKGDNFVLRVLHEGDEGWKQIIMEKIYSLDIEVDGFIGDIAISSTFEKMVICYVKVVDGLRGNECVFKTVDYQTGASVQSAFTFATGRKPYIMNAADKYIYMMQATQLDRSYKSVLSDCQEKIVGYSNGSFKMMNVFPVQCKYYELDVFVKRKAFEPDSKSFYFVSEYISTNVTRLLKTPVRSVTSVAAQLVVSTVSRGFFYVNSTWFSCSPGCNRCVNSYYCVKCASGYTLTMDTFKCVKCKGLCETCNSDSLAECFTCPVGLYYQKSKQTCLQCHSSCQTCTDKFQTKCTTCKLGFFLNNQTIEFYKKKTCLACPANCDYCYNSTQCTKCKFGYSLAANFSCIQCPLDCIQCKADSFVTCVACRTGFQNVTENNKTVCKKCPQFCENCTKGVCVKCRPGYNFNKQKNACFETCISPCKNCSLTDPSSCSSCLQGYLINGTVCQVDLWCNTNSTCTTCPSGYALIAKKCIECSLQANCLECLSDNPAVCSSCHRGYFLSANGKCTACSNDCAECFSAGICVTCKKKFMPTPSTLGASLCIPCATNCLTCIQSPTNCESCQNGYSLKGSSCISDKIVTFKFKLNLDFSNFTNELYYDLIEEVANNTNTTTSKINIIELKSGSTDVKGTITVNDTIQETATLYSLTIAYGSGGQIANQQIMETQFKGFTPDVTIIVAPEGGNKMIIIIIAIVIPVIIIVAGLLVIIIYKKYFAPVQMPPVAPSDKSQSDSDLSEIAERKARNRRDDAPRSKNTFGGSRKSMIVNKGPQAAEI